MNPERRRIEEGDQVEGWRRFGPYLSERQWGTVREDYSAGGDAWNYLPHDHARSRAYRWGEDGIGGISDIRQRLCLSFAFWNGADPILKERFFGLSGHEGNHGEDVKECYFYLDNVPSHAYMKMLYKYPQGAFPYARLVEENRRRTKDDPEFELIDTGIFEESRYFDVEIEYAKGDVDDLSIVLRATNRGPDAAPLYLLPTLWYRNTWSWAEGTPKPSIGVEADGAIPVFVARDESLGTLRLFFEGPDDLLFTENETNAERLFGTRNASPYSKDAFHAFVIGRNPAAVNPARTGTKAAALYARTLAAGECALVRMRLCRSWDVPRFDAAFDALVAQRRLEADHFYAELLPFPIGDERRAIQRQAYAGLLWSKQYYHYVVRDWLDGDPAFPPPPAQRLEGRNHLWETFYAEDVISMPDAWEYPWFAAWDLAFHVIPLAQIDPEFAKHQLVLLTRESYLHPNGQAPAYEWSFGDVNPPVHAWAAYRIFRLEAQNGGRKDYHFLERVFQKLLLNFTWWVNRKDAEGYNVFEGGFLGLDNIGPFDRSALVPGAHLEQADGSGWMGMYALSMLAIALELAQQNSVYEDIATKFFEHFLYMAAAMNEIAGESGGLWDETDASYYDVLIYRGKKIPLKVRSIVGLIPLFAHEILEPAVLERLPGFSKRLNWFIENRPDLRANVACMQTKGMQERRLLAICNRTQLERILTRVLSEERFLSAHGLRSLSRFHRADPFRVSLDGMEYSVEYEPAESRTGLFGGNSNWRGPVWFPLNVLLIEALEKYDSYYGADLTIECPAGSGNRLTLRQVAHVLSERLIALFETDANGERPAHGGEPLFRTDSNWRDLVLFYEYFDGDTGKGLGASHQTGWTGLVAKLIHDCAAHAHHLSD